MKGLPWEAQDGILRGRPRKERAPPPPILVGEDSQTYNPDLPDNTADNHSQSPKETDDIDDTDNVSMSQTPSSDGRDASHIKSKASLDDTSGVRQRLKFDGVASGMTALTPSGPRKLSNTARSVNQTLFLVSRLTGRKSDSRQNLEMAARVQLPWKSLLQTTGLTNMATVLCMRDYIARWSQIWKRLPLRRRWIACWRMKLYLTFQVMKALA